MFIQLDKYSSNSLRKGRLQAFENDIDDIYAVFNNHMLSPQQISIAQFLQIAENSQFKYLIHCRSEQEEQQQYMQMLYEVMIQNYFYPLNQSKQIFSVYSLYFLYCQLERKRKINIDFKFLKEFQSFIVRNTSKCKFQFMIVAKKLFKQCLLFGVKTGLKTVLIKPNGQAARKGRYLGSCSNLTIKSQNKKQNRSQRQQINEQQKNFAEGMNKQLSILENTIQIYCKDKQKINFQIQNEQNKLIYSDKNISIRLKKLTNMYQKLFDQQNDKKQEQQD